MRGDETLRSRHTQGSCHPCRGSSSPRRLVRLPPTDWEVPLAQDLEGAVHLAAHCAQHLVLGVAHQLPHLLPIHLGDRVERAGPWALARPCARTPGGSSWPASCWSEYPLASSLSTPPSSFGVESVTLVISHFHAPCLIRRLPRRSNPRDHGWWRLRLPCGDVVVADDPPQSLADHPCDEGAGVGGDPAGTSDHAEPQEPPPLGPSSQPLATIEAKVDSRVPSSRDSGVRTNPTLRIPTASVGTEKPGLGGEDV